MDEDARYRTSTQYRLWSFTRASLAQLREETNRVAAEKVRDAIRRARANHKSGTGTGTGASSNDTGSEAEGGDGDVKLVSNAIRNGLDLALEDVDISDVECLTVDEELKLVEFYCRQLLQLGDHLQVPTDVKATALQYFRRFYLTSSLMTYSAPLILKTALYLSTKTENHYIPLSRFAQSIDRTSASSIRASEFLLTQGLRFTFDVRHPFRALEGAIMELQSIADGAEDMTGKVIEIPEELHRVGNSMIDSTFANRVRTAHGKAREYLKSSALLTDVYFHYTPSQIMLASLLIVDESLTTFYIATKFPSPSASDSANQSNLLSVLYACSNILSSISPSLSPPESEMKELRALAKKLSRCRNPEKMDLEALSQAAKRDGLADNGEGALEERVAKKRRLEREKAEGQGVDLFGGELRKS